MVWVLVGGGKRLEVGEDGRGEEGRRRREIRIGKSEANELVIGHESVSRSHAVMGYDERKQAVWVEDASSNGTWVNGEKMETGRRIELKSGSKIKFGEDQEVYVLELVDRSQGTKELLSSLEGYGDEGESGDDAGGKQETKTKSGRSDVRQASASRSRSRGRRSRSPNKRDSPSTGRGSRSRDWKRSRSRDRRRSRSRDRRRSRSRDRRRSRSRDRRRSRSRDRRRSRSRDRRRSRSRDRRRSQSRDSRSQSRRGRRSRSRSPRERGENETKNNPPAGNMHDCTRNVQGHVGAGTNLQLLTKFQPAAGQPNRTIAASSTSSLATASQKRKLLWASKSKEETGNNTAVWTSLSSSLGDSQAQEKFLKLMGGKKPGNEAIAAGTAEKPSADGASYQNMQHNLEKEFDEALRRSQGMGKFGLG